MLTSTIACLMLACIGPAAALLAMGRRTCDGENSSLLASLDITFCNSHALGLVGGGVLTTDNETLLVNRTIVTFMRVNSSLDLWVEYWNSSYWFNGDLKLNDVVDMKKGPAAFDPLLQIFHAVVVTTLDPSYYTFLRVDVRTMAVSFYTILFSPAYDVFWNGQYVFGFIDRLGRYRYTAAGTGMNLTILGPSADSMVLIDSIGMTFAYLPNVTDLCAINCSQWITRAESSSETFSSTSLSETQTNESITSFVASSTSVGTRTSVDPAQFIWVDTVYTPDLTLPLFNYPGTFVVPPGAVLQVDLRDLSVVEGQVIPLFVFSQMQGSFSSLELLSTSCTSLFGDLQTTQTTINLVVTSSSSVCAASSKLAIDCL